MELAREWIRITTDAGPLPTYTVRPARASGPLPTILVIQEAFGVDEHIQDVADRFATAGYQALSPDLYALGGERPPAMAAPRLELFKRFIDMLPPGGWGDPAAREAALVRLPAAEQPLVRETMAALFQMRGRDDLPRALGAVVAHARQGGQKVGAVGFCMGGGMVAALATLESAPDAGVAYYGIPPPPERAASLRCPVLAHVAEAGMDPQITPAAHAFGEAAKRASKSFEVHEYPGAAHAFNNDTRLVYHPGAARLAWARTLSFLAERLV